MITKLELAYKTLDIAENKWRIEGNLVREHHLYENAIRYFMHLAFTECDSLEDVKTWLADHDEALEKALSRYIAMSKDVFAGPDEDWLVYFESGNFLLLAYSHFCAMLGQHDRAHFFAEAAIKPGIGNLPFWVEYAKLYWAMLKGHRYNAVFPTKLKDYVYWMDHIDLMKAVQTGEDTSEILAKIDRSFLLRNRDKKEYDAYMIEGDGVKPVKFDFRKAGLLASIENTKLRAV